MMTTFHETPQVVSDYPLDPFNDMLLSFLEPRAATNLIKNGSFETGVDYWTPTNPSSNLLRSDDYQWVGAYSAKMTPPATAEGVYYSGGLAFTSGVTYWGQLRFIGVPNTRYLFYFADGSGNAIGTQKLVRAIGGWEWVYWSYPETGTATRRLYITRANATDPNGTFYIDAVQVEADRLTSYLDGSLKGRGREIAYRWVGTPWGSESQRSALTNTGGTLHTFDEYNFVPSALNGLGHAPVEDVTSPIAGKGGSVYQRTNLAEERLFDVIGSISGDTLRHLMANRSALMKRLSPFRSARQQALPLNFELPNLGNVPVRVMSHYVDGMGGALDNHRSEKLALRFASYDVDIRSQRDQGSVIPYRQVITDGDYCLKRSLNGVWSAPASSINGVISDWVEGPDGSIYATGEFTTIGGVAANRIAKYDPVLGTWSALSTGLNNSGRGLAMDANGRVYVVGLFTTAGGVSANRIAMWNPDTSTWTALGTGLDSNSTGVGISSTGLVYACGSFGTAGGVAAASIAVWNPTTATWAALGTGLNASAADLTIGPDDRVYVGGAFTTAGGTSANRIAVWNPATSSWAALGTGMNSDVSDLKFSPSGLLYACGSFTTAGGNTVNHVAVWNQSAWSPLGDGVASAYKMAIDAYGRVYVAGTFDETLSGIPADSFAVWILGAWVPLEVDIPDSASVVLVQPFITRAGELWISYDTTGTAYTSEQTTLTNFGSLDAYPIYRFKGPGTVFSIRNWVTGDAIYFNLVLLAGEEAILDLTPGRISFTSSFRGDILKTILPGSNHGTFRLSTGDNLISTFILTTPAESNDNNNWFSAWDFQGATGLNTDDGRLYIGTDLVSPGVYTIEVHLNTSLSAESLVAINNSLTGTGEKTLNENNDSGLTGTATVATAPTGADLDITVDVAIVDAHWTPRFSSIDDSVGVI